MHREDFPMIKNNIVYFDSGATTFKPQVVIDNITDYYQNYCANAHRGDYHISQIASSKFEETREIIKNFINSKNTSEIVFTSGNTESINLVVFGYFRHQLKSGDEVLITKSEHASNVLPWFVLEKEIGIKVKYIKLDENKELTIDNLEESITPNTKVISIAHITNVVGDIRDIKSICALAHRHNILVLVDGAQAIAHTKVDVQMLDADFYTFSSHKIYGPTGVGILYGKYELLNKILPINYGGGMNTLFEHDGYYELKSLPHRLEAGTPNIAGVIGLGSAIEYVNNIGIDNIIKYEEELKKYLLEKLKELDFITIYNANSKGPVVAFNIKGVFSQDTSVYLDKYNICIRAGNHCTKMLKDEINIKNTCRISLALYNNKEEIDLLINVLKNSENIWKEIL